MTKERKEDVKALKYSLLVAPVIAAIALAGTAFGNPAATDMDRTKAAGWDCNPEVPIAGQYLHCSQPGKPSVADLISADGVTVPSMQLRVFNVADESFAGTETLRRADLHNPDQKCTQDASNLPGGTWGLLDLATDYYACHRFERTSTS
jgi:hypothetical protein